MKGTILKLVLALTVLGLAACAKKDTTVPDTDPEPPRDRTPAVTETPQLDANDFGNPDNLNNPESLLSKRVVYFDFDQSTIRSEYRAILNAHAQFLSSNNGYSATLEGHADERGTREYNLGLGERRSNAVADVLDARGAAQNQLGTVSYGEERPVATCSEERCWERNRRVEIVYTRG